MQKFSFISTFKRYIYPISSIYCIPLSPLLSFHVTLLMSYHYSDIMITTWLCPSYIILYAVIFFLPSPFHNMLDVTLVTRVKMEVFKCLHSTSICLLLYRTSLSFVLKKIPPNPFIALPFTTFTSSFTHDIICLL